MRPRTITAFALALLIFTIPRESHAQPRASTVAADTAALRAEIEALNASMVSAFKKEPSSVARYYHDDARILGGGTRATGRQQVDAYWAGATMFADWKLEVIQVGGHRDHPWLLGRSTLTGKSGRTMVTDFVGVLRRGPDGALRYLVDMYTAAP